MRHALLLLALVGCGTSEQTELLESWVGVYAFDGYVLNEAECAPDGVETDPPYPYLQLDAVSRLDVPSTVNLRLCADPFTCGAPWFVGDVDVLTNERITGASAEYAYLPNESCTLQWTTFELTRSGEDALHAEVRSFFADLGFVEDEDDCTAALDTIGDAAECIAYHVIDGARVR